MKTLWATLLILCSISLASCTSDEGSGSDPGGNLPPVAGAPADYFVNLGSVGKIAKATQNTTDGTNFVGYDAQGVEMPLSTQAINSYQKLPTGAYVTLTDETQADRSFIVQPDDTVEEVETTATLKGTNLNGDLIYDDATIYRSATGVLESINTTLTNPTVQSVSDNFAVLTDWSVYQIYDTVTGLRYNIASCNGPTIQAIDATYAIIDDCSAQSLINMTDGTRTSTGLDSWNHETLTGANGAIVLSEMCPNLNSWCLYQVDATGTVTNLLTVGLNIVTSNCSNCGDANGTLFSWGNYYVIKEGTQVSLVEHGIDAKTAILSQYNVLYISVENGIVYYTAEDNLGNPVTGTYDILSTQNDLLATTVQLESIDPF